MSVPLVLASSSPRRTRLLDEWGLPHRIVPSTIDESLEVAAEPGALVEALAAAKAVDVARRLEGREPCWVLAADTVVWAGSPLGKPDGEAEARAMLLSLSGRAVDVLTGVAVVPPGSEPLVSYELTVVTMRPYTREEVAAYVTTGEPLGKAGAFAIQGDGRRLIDGVEGSVTNVIGLPRRVVFRLLEQSGYPGAR